MALQANIDDHDTLNMTPMIDVVFNLLIFFLLGSTYLNEERELELTLPTVSQASPLTEAPDEITVNVLADGTVTIRGQSYTEQELLEFLQQARRNYADQAVAVRGDADARYESIANVLALCKQAQIARMDVLVLDKGS